MNRNIRDLIRYTEEVGQALVEKRPIVALESTVIAHGLPQPLNLQVAARMEEIVRERGATPATIAILDGKIHLGLNESERERVGAGQGIKKASLRDLPLLLTSGGSGATTVSATAHLAMQAGIPVFATGGIGGVHRGWETSMDISPDLPALASTPITVVCAGAKSVLDIPATLEWLETHGVPVLGYRTDRFPAFYTPVSDPPLPVDARIDRPEEVAAIMRMRGRLGPAGGVLVCAPVPSAAALTRSEVSEAIEAALEEAQRKGIRGREVTPFLLEALSRSTGGRTLAANRALLENNAGIAAEVSRAFYPDRSI